MAESVNPSPSTYLVKSINGSRRVMIYYDPDIFTEQILLSASYLIGEDNPPWNMHYNTVHDEVTDGTNFQDLEDITIAICPLPLATEIIGKSNVALNSTETYSVPTTYDVYNNYLYSWTVVNATIVGDSDTREVEILFDNSETVKLTLEISNTCGCKRVYTRNLYPASYTRSILILQNNY